MIKHPNNIKIIFEDNDLIILDKPTNVLVHPTEAKESNTLTLWFEKKYPDLIKQNWPDKTRPGVIHRLDKNTSGLIIMAKNPEILLKLQEMFKSRQIQKTYTALVYGNLKEDGKIEAAITRGETGLQKVLDNVYSFSKEKIRPAITNYKIIKHFQYHKDDLTLIKVMPKTGRMHQIRVHLKHIGHPIIGDPLYNTKPSRAISKGLNLDRQFLHASKLEFIHPVTLNKIQLESPLPKDLKNIMVKPNE